LPDFETIAQDRFGAAVSVSLGRNGIKLGRIEKIDSLVAGIVHLLKSLFGCILFAKGHGAQAEKADLQVGPAEKTVFHF
jgi:hypothetical protein